MDSFSVANIDFTLSFAGKEHVVKKANLQQVIQFQRRSKELSESKDAAADMLIAAYAIYLILHGVDTTITEDYILENTAGDIDVIDIISKLGFMSQQKVETMKKLRNSLGK